MAFWWVVPILINIGAFIAERSLLKRPKVDKPKPDKFTSDQLPIVTEASAIPVIWGTVRLDAVNVLWFGAPDTREIIQGGQVVGHRYFLTLQYGLCLGPIDRVLGVEWDDLQANIYLRDDGPVYDTLFYRQQHLFGDPGGGGGIYTEIRAYKGTTTQPPDAHLEEKTGDLLPGYRNLAYLMMRGHPFPHSVYDPCILVLHDGRACPCPEMLELGLCITTKSAYVGHSATLHSMAVEVRRVDQCNPLGLTGGAHDIDGDANPANMIYEIIHDGTWGLGIPDNQGIDKPSFVEVGQALAAEEFGLSMTTSGGGEARSLINEILHHIDGVLALDPDTGLLQLRLIRGDYVVEELPVFGPNEIRSLSLSRPAQDTLSNVVSVTYTDRVERYKPCVASAQDLAAIQQSGKQIIEDVSYLGVTKSTLAQQIAARELKVASYPWALVKFTVDRSAWNLRQGSPFKLDWPDLGIVGMICRVSRISPGDLVKGEITIDAVEDVFGVSWTAFGPIPPSGWEDPFESE